MRNAAFHLECSTVGRQTLAAHIERIRNLGALSEQYQRLSRLVLTKLVNLQQVIDIIEQKPSFVANLLKMANTAYYDQSQKVDSVKGAIQAIGIKEIADILLSLEIIKTFGVPNGIDCERYWDHAVTVATLARSIAEQNRLDGEMAYKLGLLHDVGLLTLARFSPEDFALVMERVSSKNSVYKVAPQVIGFTHIDLTVELMKQWDLHADIQSTLQLFYKDQQCAVVQHQALSSVLYAAHRIAETNRYAFSWDILPAPARMPEIKTDIAYEFASGIGAALLACYHS